VVGLIGVFRTSADETDCLFHDSPHFAARL